MSFSASTMRNCSDESNAARNSSRPSKRAAVGQHARGVDRVAQARRSSRQRPVASKPSSAKPTRVHQRVARRAARVRAVRCEPVAQRQHRAVAVGYARRLERRHVCGRRRRLGAEQVLENPMASDDGRRAIGVRGHGEQAAVTEQARDAGYLPAAARAGNDCPSRSAKP